MHQYVISKNAEELTGSYQSGFCDRDQLLVTYSTSGKPRQNTGSITYHYYACSPIPNGIP